MDTQSFLVYRKLLQKQTSQLWPRLKQLIWVLDRGVCHHLQWEMLQVFKIHLEETPLLLDTFKFQYFQTCMLEGIGCQSLRVHANSQLKLIIIDGEMHLTQPIGNGFLQIWKPFSKRSWIWLNPNTPIWVFQTTTSTPTSSLPNCSTASSKQLRGQRNFFLKCTWVKCKVYWLQTISYLENCIFLICSWNLSKKWENWRQKKVMIEQKGFQNTEFIPLTIIKLLI